MDATSTRTASGQSDNLAPHNLAPHGIALMLCAFLLFSFIDTGVKWLSLLGLSAMQLAFMRYFGHFVVSLTLIAKRGFSKAQFTSPHLFLVILRATMLMLSTALNFWALAYLPLTLTSTILFSSPIIVCFLSWPILGERVGPFRWVAIILGFIGVAVAIRPFDDSFHWAMLLSLGSAFGFASYSLLTGRLAKIAPLDVMQFYTGAVGTFALLPVAIMQWQSPQTVTDWGVLISIGLFGWAGHQLLTKAHQFAPASTLTPLAYSFILYLAIWSYLLFDTLPDRWTLIGGFLIICSGLIIWLRETRLKNRSSADH